MINAVIFDMDGLLIDSENMSYMIYQDILEIYGHKISIADYVQGYCGKTEIHNVTMMIHNYSLPITIEEGLEKVLELEHHYIARGLMLKPGAKDLLVYLKAHDYKTVMATSSLKERAYEILQPHDILKYFDAFVYGNEVKKGKPHPDIFLKACKKIAERPEQCLVLEDSEAGIQAAYTANIPVICVPDIKQPAQNFIKMTKAVIKSLNEVMSYLIEYL